MRNTVQTDRNNAQIGLTNARTAVSNAKYEVSKLKGEIDDWKRWYNKLPALDLPGKESKVTESVRYAAAVAWRTTALVTARGTLITVNAALKLVKDGITSVPIDDDPRVKALILEKKIKKKLLDTANTLLTTAKSAITVVSIESDPRMMLEAGEKAGAKLALATARNALDLARQGIGGLADLASVAKNAKTIIEVRKAEFDANLAIAHTGKVQLSMDVTFMDKPKHVEIEFNFMSIEDSIKALVAELLPESTIKGAYAAGNVNAAKGVTKPRQRPNRQRPKW